MTAGGRTVDRTAGLSSLMIMGGLAVVLVVLYAALGGGSYKPLEVADPCEPREVPPAKGLEEVSEQLLLSGLDGAACRLRVTREDLLLALTSERARERFAREHRVSDETLEQTIRAGVRRAVADAERRGRLSPTQASTLRSAANVLPIGALIEAFQTGRGLVDALGELLRR